MKKKYEVLQNEIDFNKRDRKALEETTDQNFKQIDKVRKEKEMCNGSVSEREKLMFRVKAQIPIDLLKQHIEKVKTGLPGEVWVKLNDNAEWPSDLPELVD